MSATMEKPAMTTADDTLKAKIRDGAVVSAGHLLVRALKAEGVDIIFTLCGSHSTVRRG